MEQLTKEMKEFIYKGIAVAGLILVLLPPLIVRFMKDEKGNYIKLNKQDFVTQIFIACLLGLLCIMFTSYMLLKDETDELFFQILVGVTAITSISINFGVIFMSMLRMRWAAD